MSEKQRVTGPASYFPSIEKRYGKPIEHWMTLLSGLKDMKHMEMVNWLKTKHGMGYGHANALVGYFRAHPTPGVALAAYRESLARCGCAVR